jgi:hypothetical protein
MSQAEPFRVKTPPHEPTLTEPSLSALLFAAPAAWMVMMLSGGSLMSLAMWLRVRGEALSIRWDEYVLAFVLAFSLPFALAIVVVYMPVIVAMRRARLPGEPVALFALAGMLAAPVAGALLLSIGHALARSLVTTAFWPDVRRLIAQDPGTVLLPLAALVAGGAVFGAGFAWALRYVERPFEPANPDLRT